MIDEPGINSSLEASENKKNTRAKISPVYAYVFVRANTIIFASRNVDDNESINVKPHK